MEKHQAHVRYSAEQYDSYTSSFVRHFDLLLAGRIVEEVGGRRGLRLLDIGTGTARLLVHLANEPSLDGVRLIGTDVFTDMVERARGVVNAEALGARILLAVDDVHAMGIADGSIDVIISRSTIHHWSDPVRALREIFRTLRAGGIAILHDVRRDPAPEAIEEFNRLRAKAGIGPSFLDEKFTVAEVEGFTQQAGIAPHARVLAATKGLNALGYALEIRKPS
jgi:ubiquinone/menaquinone biosynthesis C-methylase UbiE